MLEKTAISAGIRALQRLEKKEKGGGFQKKDGSTVYYSEAIKALQKLRGLVNPKLNSDHMEMIVNCYNCTQFLACQKMCQKLGVEVDGNFYCYFGKLYRRLNNAND